MEIIFLMNQVRIVRPWVTALSEVLQQPAAGASDHRLQARMNLELAQNVLDVVTYSGRRYVQHTGDRGRVHAAR